MSSQHGATSPQLDRTVLADRSADQVEDPKEKSLKDIVKKCSEFISYPIQELRTCAMAVELLNKMKPTVHLSISSSPGRSGISSPTATVVSLS